MPEARGFGRRGIPQAPRPFDGPAWVPPADIEPTEQDHLNVTAQRLRLGGELLVFTGLFVALVTSVFQALHPVASELRRIYIPQVLGAGITFTSPEAPLLNQYLMPYATSMAWPAMLAFGLFAISRGRWLLAGLCAATLAFPWSLLGVVLPYAPIALVLLGGAAVHKIYRPSGVKLVVTLILAFLVGPVVISWLASIVNTVIYPGGVASAKYHVVTFAELEANKGLPRTETNENGRKIVRVTTLSALPARSSLEQGAKAFAMAQEYVIRGNVAMTAQVLEALEQSEFVPNRFERDRLEEIKNALTALGAYGDQARIDLEASQNAMTLLHRLTLYFAIALGLLGPVAEIVGARISKRQGRIQAAEQELVTQRAQRAPVAAKGFGRRDGGAGIQSISAIDGEATLASIDKRLQFYVLGAAVLGIVTVLAGVAGWLMWLPDASNNTAFQRVALTARAAGWAAERGLDVIQGPMPLVAIIMMALTPTMFLMAIAFMFFRRFAPYIAGAALAVVVFWQISSFFFVDQALYEVEASAITRDLRAELTRDALTPTMSSAQGTALPSFSNVGKADPNRMTLEPADAALILAEIDYIEGRPAEIGRWLDVMGDNPRAISALSLEQRFDLMGEWAGANGHPSTARILAPSQILPMGVSRALAMPSVVVAVIAALGTVGIICLVPVAADRRRRIEDLVEQVRYRQDEYRTAR